MRPIHKITVLLCLIGLFCMVLPTECPAPLVWRKGEGWTFERAGVTTATTPQEQLQQGKSLQASKHYGEAIAAYRRLVRRWPDSSAAQDARLGLAESLGALQYYYKAYKTYQELIEKNPNSPYFETALQREFEIANLFLGGEKHKALGMRLFPALDKSVEIYEKIAKTGPYSKVGPESQFRIGLVYEKQREYLTAVHAFEKMLERYPQHPLAEEAQYQIGWAYKQEAKRADYDQNAANQSIAAFNDFLIRYPNNDKAAAAEKNFSELNQEQARGLFHIGAYYENRKSYKAALIYYNQVIEQAPKSDWAAQAQKKVALLNARAGASTGTP